jgi:hypothetical protein
VDWGARPPGRLGGPGPGAAEAHDDDVRGFVPIEVVGAGRAQESFTIQVARFLYWSHSSEIAMSFRR